ncbi:MAG: esterase/lipase family protein [Sphingobium sp.]
MDGLSPSLAASPPPFAKLLGEMRVLSEIRRGWRYGPAMATDHDGDGRPVMVIPGFLAADGSTVMLRRTLKAANFRTYGWGEGRNFGVKADILERLDRRLDYIQRECGGPVALIGWSLGGLIAREYAKHAPDRIDRVITMGSPFSGDLRANHAWRLYELINRHPVDQGPLAVNLTEKPPVPTYALWSENDGIVSPLCSRGLPHESDRAWQVECGHLGFTTSPDSIHAIFEALDA